MLLHQGSEEKVISRGFCALGVKQQAMDVNQLYNVSQSAQWLI